MKKERTLATIAGILLLSGTVSGIISVSLTNKMLETPHNLTEIASGGNRLIPGAFFMVIMAISCSGIAIAMYPILKRANSALAIGAVGFRFMEGILHTIAVLGMLSLFTLGQHTISLNPLECSRLLEELLKSGLANISHIFILIFWCLGASMYYVIFIVYGLVPKWLSIWGLAGTGLTMIASIGIFFKIVAPMSTAQVIMNIPIGIQEMGLAVWLIVNGFNTSNLNKKEEEAS